MIDWIIASTKDWTISLKCKKDGVDFSNAAMDAHRAASQGYKSCAESLPPAPSTPTTDEQRQQKCKCIKDWLLPLLLASSACLKVARATIETMPALLHKWHEHSCEKFFELSESANWMTLAVNKEMLAAQAQMLAFATGQAGGEKVAGKKADDKKAEGKKADNKKAESKKSAGKNKK